MAGRRKGTMRSRGRQKQKPNRYNPNAPDWKKVQAPWAWRLMEVFGGKQRQ